MTVSLTSIRRSFTNSSQLICLPSKQLSWRDRRSSTSPTISRQSSLRPPGGKSRVGCWYRQKTERSIQISNGGTPREPKVTQWKFQARATPSTSPDQRRSLLQSKKLHRTLGRKWIAQDSSLNYRCGCHELAKSNFSLRS